MMARRPDILTGPRRRLTLGAMIAAIGAALAVPAAAQQPPPLTESLGEPGERAIITADELTHDRAMDTVTARGNVEIQYGGRILMADTVNYQINKDFASASGNVVIVDINGTTTFADYAELTGDFKEGFAREVRIRLTDGSRVAANEVQRTAGNRTEANYGVYSPCDACGANDDRLWQVKARRVIHDQDAQQISYRDTWLEIAGIPVLYTPYLSHPDPTVKRRSGVLAPGYSSSTELGFAVSVPYFIVISDHQDATIEPMYTTEKDLVLLGEYRGIGTRAKMFAEGSVTYDDEDDPIGDDNGVRYHLDASGQVALSDVWRTGADVELVSDDDYLRDYNIAYPRFLTSRAYAEGFDRRSFTVVEGFSFRNIETGGEPPLVAPSMATHIVTAPNRYGAWYTTDISTDYLSRDDGVSSSRLSAQQGWHLPHIGPLGDVYRLDVSLRGDLYYVDDQDQVDSTTFQGFKGRLIPQAALTWSYPFERRTAGWRDVIEPVIQGVISPRGQNHEEIPNEDSLDFEFDDTNLFSTNRFTGWDRVESGPRVNYGLKYGAYHPEFGRVSAVFGQSYHLFNDGLFNDSSGLSEEFSDYVGSVQMAPSTNFDLSYRFRLDKDTFEARRNELRANVGPPILRLSTTYLSIEGDPLEDGGVEEQETLAVGLHTALSQYWRTGVSGNWDLGQDGGPVRFAADATYEDECFLLTVFGERDYDDGGSENEGGFSFGFRVVFKTLGEVGSSSQ